MLLWQVYYCGSFKHVEKMHLCIGARLHGQLGAGVTCAIVILPSDVHVGNLNRTVSVGPP